MRRWTDLVGVDAHVENARPALEGGDHKEGQHSLGNAVEMKVIPDPVPIYLRSAGHECKKMPQAEVTFSYKHLKTKSFI